MFGLEVIVVKISKLDDIEELKKSQDENEVVLGLNLLGVDGCGAIRQIVAD